MGITNINNDKFRDALAREMPGLSVMIDGSTDMMELRFYFKVSSTMESFYDSESAYERVKVLAERVKQEALVKTGAFRTVQAANEQAEQYRQDNLRLSHMVQDRDEQIRNLNQRIRDLQDQIAEMGS